MFRKEQKRFARSLSVYITGTIGYKWIQSLFIYFLDVRKYFMLFLQFQCCWLINCLIWWVHLLSQLMPKLLMWCGFCSKPWDLIPKITYFHGFYISTFNNNNSPFHFLPFSLKLKLNLGLWKFKPYKTLCDEAVLIPRSAVFFILIPLKGPICTRLAPAGACHYHP